MKKLFLCLAFSCTTFIGNAQFAAGVAGSVNLFLVEKEGAFPAVSPLLEYALQEGQLVLRGSFTLFFPKNHNTTSYASAINYNTNPQEIAVTTTQKLNVMAGFLDVKRYLGEATLSEGGVYVGGGVGVYMASVTNSHSPFDTQNYSLITYQGTTAYNQWMIRGFAGYDKAFDFGTLFAEFQLAMAINRAPVIGGMNIPGSVGLVIGYKYIFGKEESDK